MPVVLNEGNTSKLIITIPAKGDTNWAGIFQAAMQAISDHDHSGAGKGAKIQGSALEDGAITTSKLAADAVDGTKIADNSITAAHIVDGTIIAADVADGAITAAKIGSDVPLGATNIASTSDLSTLQSSYSILNITGSCECPTTLENKTINIASGATLTIGDGDTIKNCTITGEGKILMTATDSRSGLQTTAANTVTMKGCTVNIEEFDIKQDLANPRGLAAVIIEDSFINTDKYRYYLEFDASNTIDDAGGDTSTTSPSQFTNVTIFAKNIIFYHLTILLIICLYY